MRRIYGTPYALEEIKKGQEVTAMKATRNLMSALLGIAMLAVPVVASAQPRNEVRNRPVLPTYQKATVYRPLPARPIVVTRRAVVSPIVPIRDRDDWRWRDRDDHKYRNRDDGRYGRDHDRDDCRLPQVNRYDYRDGYRPDYLQRDSYNNYAPPSAEIRSDARLASLIRQRDNAVLQYRAALRRHDNTAAGHLANAIEELNKRIASVRQHIGNTYRPVSYDSYGPAGYGTPDFTSMVTPLLGSIY